MLDLVRLRVYTRCSTLVVPGNSNNSPRTCLPSFKNTQNHGQGFPISSSDHHFPSRRFVVCLLAICRSHGLQYIGLQILEKLIITRWKTLPDGQRQGIRNFIVGVTVKVASDDVSLRKEKTYINKLNLALVQVSSDIACAQERLRNHVCRSSSRSGHTIGPTSSASSSTHPKRTSPCVRTTWSSSSFYRKRFSTSQQNK